MIRKCKVKPRVVVHESGKDNPLMQKFIASEISRKQWPYDVIEGRSEAEFVIRKTKDYLILPDMERFESFHWLILFTDVLLKSMRSLRGEHLPLLHEVRNVVKRMNPTAMVYFHYPPSVWQLHLHIVNASSGLRTTSDMQRVHFLEDVISNIEIDSEYYAKATLSFVLPENHDIVTSVYPCLECL